MRHRHKTPSFASQPQGPSGLFAWHVSNCTLVCAEGECLSGLVFSMQRGLLHAPHGPDTAVFRPLISAHLVDPYSLSTLILSCLHLTSPYVSFRCNFLSNTFLCGGPCFGSIQKYKAEDRIVVDTAEDWIALQTIETSRGYCDCFFYLQLHVVVRRSSSKILESLHHLQVYKIIAKTLFMKTSCQTPGI